MDTLLDLIIALCFLATGMLIGIEVAEADEGLRITCYGNSCSMQPDDLAITTQAGHLSLGASHGENMYIFNGDRSIHTCRYDGDWQVAGSETDIYNTFSMSHESDAGRIKIGGGSDTNTERGGRVMLHGASHRLSPGMAILEGANTDNIGEDGKGAFVSVWTRAEQPIIFGTHDTPRIYIDPDGPLHFLGAQDEEPRRKRRVRKYLKIRVQDQDYFIELRR